MLYEIRVYESSRAHIYGAKLITRRQTYTHNIVGTPRLHIIQYGLCVQEARAAYHPIVLSKEIYHIIYILHFVGIYTHDDNYYFIIYHEVVSPSTRYYNIIVGRSVDEPTMAYGKRYGKYLSSKNIRRVDACSVLQLLYDVAFESPLIVG